MEIIKFVVACFIFMSTCFAVENQTLDLEKPLKIQKREKQYLIEDDPCDGPEQKREERQSSPGRTNQIDSKLKPKPLNVRIQPKILTAAPLKPVLKPAVLPKPINIRIDNSPQRIPTKIPVVLKTAKVIPAPAHALRLKMIENRKNNSILNKEIDYTNKENKSSTNKEDQLIRFKEDNIPFTIENKVIPNVEGRMGPNKEDDIILNQESKIILNNDGKVILNKDGKVTTIKADQVISNKDGKDILNNDKTDVLDRDGKSTPNEEDKFVPNPVVNIDVNFKKETLKMASEDVSKPVHFFIDEADPLPPDMNKEPKLENQSTKNKAVLTKMKEIPITKKMKNKSKNDDAKYQENVDQTEHEPDIVRISNGTHIITIKRIRNHNKHKIEHSQTGSPITESRLHDEERIINQRPPKSSPPADEPQKFPSGFTESEENVLLAVFGDNKKKEDKHIEDNTEVKHPDTKDNKDKDSSDCITVTNHKYEEFEERTTIPPPVPTNTYYDDGSQRSWNNLQNPQNLYYNPYNQNIYDQYRRYYNVPRYDPNIQTQENNEPNAYTPEYTQAYLNEIQPNFNVDYSIGDQPEIDVSTNCPDMLRTENTLDRIWRAWKDVEIKIRKSQLRDEPNIDIRRNMADSSGSNAEVVAKVPTPYATQPIGFNGYYNNQNSALIYPYMNPTYRYMR